jgi:hypothetical protein
MESCTAPPTQPATKIPP